MSKETAICFRTSEDVRRALEAVARGERRSLSSAIVIILTDYLKGSKVADSGQQERRKYPRKAVTLPTYITTPDSQGPRHGAVVLDISLGGMRASMPKECVSEIYENGGKSQFEASFVIPGNNKTIRVVCNAERVTPSNDGVQVGAVFIDADFVNYQNLQKFLI